MAHAAMVAVAELQQLQQQLAKDLEFVGLRTKAYTNRKRSTEPTLKKGDKVYLQRKHIKIKRPSTKLDFKKIGPFEIIEKIGSVNYRLKLPRGSQLHPIFHVSLLELAKGSTPTIVNDDIQLENDEGEYEVEKILDARKQGHQQQYLIK